MGYEELIAGQKSAAPLGDGERRVLGWISYHSVGTRDDLTDVGCWGGDIKPGDKWADYIALIDAPAVPHHEALRRAIVERGLRRGGDWHQYGPDGVPVFDDGAIALFSFRGWGDLLAASWAEPDGRDYGYMDFYMDACLEQANIPLSPPLET